MNKELKKIIDNNHIAVHLGMNVLCIEAYLKKYYPSHEWPKYAHILWGFLASIITM